MGPNLPPEPDASVSVLGRIDDVASRVVQAIRDWGLWLAAIGLAPGLALWPMNHKEHFNYVLKNNLAQHLRPQILLWMGISSAVVIATYLASWGLRRRRDSAVSFGQHARQINRYAFVAVVLPLLTALRHDGFEAKHRFLTLLMITAAAFGTGVFLYRVAPTVRSWLERVPRKELINRWLPRLLLIGACGWYGTRLSSLAIIDHQNLGTHIWDLAIYDNLLWKTMNGDFLACVFCKGGKHTSGHFDPVLGLLVPLYRAFPRAETLLTFQAWWLSTGVFPLYLLASRRLGHEWYGAMLAAIYIMYPALHGANMFDFHSLTLSIPTFLWLIYFLDSGRNLGYWLSLALLLATREDMSLLASFTGIYAITQRRTVLGISTIVLALSYLVYVKTNVMPEAALLMKSKQASSFIYYYKEMIPYPDEGLRGLLISAITNPLYVLQVATKEGKLMYALALLVPVGFLPLISGAKRLIMLYGLVFVGLASRKYVYSLYFQYSAVLFPIMLASVPDAVARLRDSELVARLKISGRRLAPTLMLTAVVSTALTSMEFGALAKNKNFRAGWNRFGWTVNKKRAQRYATLEKLKAQIPDESSVCATNELGPHISARADAAMWPRCKNMDFMLLHTKRFKKKHRKRLDRMVLRGQYRLLERRSGLSLYELVPKEERAEARKIAREQQRDRKEKARKKKEAAQKKGDTEPVITPAEDADRPDTEMDEAEQFRSQVMGLDPDDNDNDQDQDQDQDAKSDTANDRDASFKVNVDASGAAKPSKTAPPGK